MSKGLFVEPAPGRFALNETAQGLVGEAGRLGFDLDGFDGRMAHAWGTLLSAVRSGKPACHEAFGRAFWEDLDAHPDIAAGFDALMGPAGHGVPDWRARVDPAPDREATAILKRCAEAARPSGRVVVFTGAGPDEEASPELLMMVLGGGRGRTLDELREMAHQAGLEVRAVGRQASGRVIVECRAR